MTEWAAVQRADTSMLWEHMRTGTRPPAAGSGGQAPSVEGSPLLASVRGLLFYLWTFTLAFPLFAVMLLQAPFVAAFDKHRSYHFLPMTISTWSHVCQRPSCNLRGCRRAAQHFVNNIWAKVSTRLFYRVKVCHCPSPRGGFHALSQRRWRHPTK